MTDVKTHATSVGFDINSLLDFVKGINWVQLWQLIQLIIATFKGGGGAAQKMASAPGAGCGPDELACIKEHFCCIKACAECGEECCC